MSCRHGIEPAQGVVSVADTAGALFIGSAPKSNTKMNKTNK